MPLLQVKISGEENQQITHEINRVLMKLTTTLLGKDPKVTAIVIEYIPRKNWFIAGRNLADNEKYSFSLEIKVTDETNTKIEKQNYINAVFIEFFRILKNIDEESYIHIHDVKAASYGYGGYTQEYRYQQTVAA